MYSFFSDIPSSMLKAHASINSSFVADIIVHKVRSMFNASDLIVKLQMLIPHPNRDWER